MMMEIGKQNAEELVIASRATAFLFLLLFLSYFALVLGLLAFIVSVTFGPMLGVARFVGLIVIISLLLLLALFLALSHTYYFIRSPRVLVKISNGTLYIFPSRKKRLAMDSLNIYRLTSYKYRVRRPLQTDSGKIIIETDKGIIRLRFVKDVEKIRYLLEKVRNMKKASVLD